MKYMNSLHPINAMLFFVAVIFITMFSVHPVMTAVAFVASVAVYGSLCGIKKAFSSLACGIPIMIMIALVNPIFVHRGETILFFLNDNPVTKEAIIYGFYSAFMLASVYYWFMSYHFVMTSDKFIYLFGRVIPKLSLLLSMVLNFVPLFKKRYKQIDEAQRAMGIYSGNSYFDKIRSKMRVISSLITMSLENSVALADSMRARGYGLKGRTSYSIFKWKSSDGTFFAVMLVAVACITVGFITGADYYSYYPTLMRIDFDALVIMTVVALAVVMLMPVVLQIKEEIQWRYLKSKI